MMSRWITIALVALFAAGPALADQGQAQDKGKGKEQAQAQGQVYHGPDQAQGSGQGQGRSQAQNKGQDNAPGNDPSNYGQVVSDCNHQANERKLQGQDRKHFVEWCSDRGERYGYDQQRYNYDRNCYQSADGKGLTDSLRKAFLGDCLSKRDREYETERKREQDRDGNVSVPGRDVLNKSGQKK